MTPRTVNTAVKPATNASAWRIASQRSARTAGAPPATAIGAQLAQVGGHERQHARREEADEPGREGDEDRQVRAGHARVGLRVEDLGEQAAQPGRARRELETAVAELDDRDRREEGRFQAGSASMSRSTRVGTAWPRCGARRAGARSRARVSSHRRAIRARRTGRGRGRGRRSSRSDCTVGRLRTPGTKQAVAGRRDGLAA